jgi:hypothetical protein
VPAALTFVALLKRLPPRAAASWATAGVIAIITQQMAFTPRLPVLPMTGHLRQADELARRYPEQIYFPWNTLVTFFTDHRFYHAEDGIYTRHIAQFGTGADVVRLNLPPRWLVTAILGGRNDDIFKQLQPSPARKLFFGEWTLYLMSPANLPPSLDAPQRERR